MQAFDAKLKNLKKMYNNNVIKGGDYIADQVVGADIVAARGGQVLIISTLDGHATSKLITA